jgi:hypothetical protein
MVADFVALYRDLVGLFLISGVETIHNLVKGSIIRSAACESSYRILFVLYRR